MELELLSKGHVEMGLIMLLLLAPNLLICSNHGYRIRQSHISHLASKSVTSVVCVPGGQPTHTRAK